MLLSALQRLWQRLTRRPPPGPPSKRARGNRAEAWAARRLQAQGYRILERNLVLGGGEIDLLALHEGWLVIVEVRSYRQAGGLPPHTVFSRDKQRRLRRLADHVVKRREWRRYSVRIDLVEVAVDERDRPVALEIYRGVC